MYLFGCEDTTTIVMNYFTKKELRPILCINKELYKIKYSSYFKIRTVQDFIKKYANGVYGYRRITCHSNLNYCKKIKFSELYRDIDKYRGKTIQFILKNKYYIPCRHYIMWESMLEGVTNRHAKFIKGINVKHIGYINCNIHSVCNCSTVNIPLNSQHSYTFMPEYDIYPHSLRIIL